MRGGSAHERSERDRDRTAPAGERRAGGDGAGDAGGVMGAAARPDLWRRSFRETCGLRTIVRAGRHESGRIRHKGLETFQTACPALCYKRGQVEAGLLALASGLSRVWQDVGLVFVPDVRPCKTVFEAD